MANTCFKRQKNKLATYVFDNIVCTLDYLLPRRCDRRQEISGEACVAQHQLLLGVVIRKLKFRSQIARRISANAIRWLTS